MKVRPISVTKPLPEAIPGLPDASPEAVMVYCARVSNPRNQTNHATAPKLLKYCIDHGHWSVFEMVDWTVEIETSRAIAAQILRHRSFSFQEFSQRYAPVTNLGEMVQEVEVRVANPAGNRQGSVAPDQDVMIGVQTADQIVEAALCHATAAYDMLLRAGVAPECARMVLPLAATTRLYMKGSVRSWIHYIQVRCDEHAQKEHRALAHAVRGEFIKAFPAISQALGW